MLDCAGGRGCWWGSPQPGGSERGSMWPSAAQGDVKTETHPHPSHNHLVHASVRKPAWVAFHKVTGRTGLWLLRGPAMCLRAGSPVPGPVVKSPTKGTQLQHTRHEARPGMGDTPAPRAPHCAVFTLPPGAQGAVGRAATLGCQGAGHLRPG